MPQVSVLMPVYNAAAFLGEAMSSLESDLDRDIEVVAVNDGSTDASGELLDRWKSENVKVIHQPNRGLVCALQAATAHASGTLFARMDADDRNLPGRLATLIAQFQSDPDLVLAATWQRQINSAGEVIHPGHCFAWDAAAVDRALYVTNPLSHGPTMFRREAYEQAGGYLPSMCEDLHLWDRMSDLGRVTIVPKVLYEYRTGIDSVTSRHAAEQAVAAEAIKQSRWDRRPPRVKSVASAVVRYRRTSARSIHRAQLRDLAARARARDDHRRFSAFAAAWAVA